MLCHITGTLYKPDGTLYSGAFVKITSVPRVIESAHLGSVVPRITTIETGADGEVDFHLVTGEYIVSTSTKRGDGGGSLTLLSLMYPSFQQQTSLIVLTQQPL